MLFVLLVLSQFAFVAVHSSVNVHPIFQFVLKNALLFGISKLLKECLLSCTSDLSGVSYAMQNGSSFLKPFYLLTKFMSRLLSSILKRTKWHDLRSETWVKFLKKEARERVAGLLTVNKVLGLPKAKHYNYAYSVLPCFGEISILHSNIRYRCFYKMCWGVTLHREKKIVNQAGLKQFWCNCKE